MGSKYHFFIYAYLSSLAKLTSSFSMRSMNALSLGLRFNVSGMKISRSMPVVSLYSALGSETRKQLFLSLNTENNTFVPIVIE